MPILPFAGLLLAGGSCLTGKQAATVLDSTDQGKHNKSAQPQVSILSSGLIGSISYMGGAIANYVLQIKGKIMGPKPVSQLAFIWRSDANNLNRESPIVKNAIGSKNDVEKFLLQNTGEVVYWEKECQVGTGTKEWILPVSKEAGEKLTKNQYLHALYVPGGVSPQNYLVSAAPVQMDSKNQGLLIPDYQNNWFGS